MQGQTKRSALLAGSALMLLNGAGFAQDAPGSNGKHGHLAGAADRLDLLEQEIKQQAKQMKLEEAEIAELKAQLTRGSPDSGGASSGAGGSAPTAQPEVTAARFQDLQNKVARQEEETRKRAIVSFTKANPFLHEKTQPTISSRDGRWTFAPVVLVQGDWADYSKGRPLALPGTTNLKSSGENIRRARLGFQGTLARDFGYSLVMDFGGSNGDETYQGYAGPNSGQVVNGGGKNISPSTANTGAGSGAHVYSAYLGYRGILDPFTFKVGALPPPANLSDATQSDDLLFNERPSPAQISRGLDADEGRESVGFAGNGDIWNASLFLTGDSFGKGALIAPATTYGGGQEAVVGRVAIAPWQNPDTNFTIHLGANFGYVIHPQESTNTQNPGFTAYNILFSDRPELRVDNVTFINTGAIDAKSAHTYGVEAAASYGPFLLQAENFWYGIHRNNPGNPPPGITDPIFSGWYVEGSWVFTGEPRPYNIANASFTRPSPVAPFDPANGNWGAWELAGRYSSADFDYHLGSQAKYAYVEPGSGGNTLTVSDAVFGGRQNIVSAGVNFYPNDVMKFMFDWQDVQLKNIGALNNNGHYETLEIRTQISF